MSQKNVIGVGNRSGDFDGIYMKSIWSHLLIIFPFCSCSHSGNEQIRHTYSSMATPLIARRTVAASAGASLSRRMMRPTSASTVSITQSSRALNSLVGGQRKPVNGRVMSASRDVRSGATRGIFNRLAGGQGDLVKKEESEVPAKSINFDVGTYPTNLELAWGQI